MSHIITPQPPTRQYHPTWRDLNILSFTDDSLMWALEQRVVELEHALVSRKARRRLRREIRARAKAYAWARSFEAARAEATTYDWLNRPGPRVEDIPPVPEAGR